MTLRIKPFPRPSVEPEWHDGVFHVLLCGMAGLVLAYASVGCVQGEPLQIDSLDTEPVTESDDQVFTRVSFSATFDLLKSVEDAAQRWSASTCRDIVVDGSGKTYRSVPYTEVPLAWGHAEGNEIRIYDRLRAENLDLTTTHEMGHGLAGAGHSSSGLQSENSRHNVINTSSLDYVCSRFDCLCFSPEST